MDGAIWDFSGLIPESVIFCGAAAPSRSAPKGRSGQNIFLHYKRVSEWEEGRWERRQPPAAAGADCERVV